MGQASAPTDLLGRTPATGKSVHGAARHAGAILAATQGRGFDLLLVLICLPFLTPIPLLGLSTPFGLVVFLIGARLAFGRHPWLPRRLLERELPSGFTRNS